MKTFVRRKAAVILLAAILLAAGAGTVYAATQCFTCKGTGWEICGPCRGTGRGNTYRPGPNGTRIYNPCPACNGQGKRVCRSCGGDGWR